MCIVLGQVWYLIVSSPDLCILTPFNLLKIYLFIFKILLNIHRPKKQFSNNKSPFGKIKIESFTRKGVPYKF